MSPTTALVTHREIRTEDVTLNYVDMESRIEALKIEKKSLEKLLGEAKNLTDLFSIQERLTEVIYEIESYESQLRTYDNLIDYTTVTIYISEVERTIAAENQSIWQEIGTNISTMPRISALSLLPYSFGWPALCRI